MQTSPYLLLFLLMAGACNRSGAPEPKPVAQFDAPASAETGAAITVRNTSTAATSYEWTWGDGTSSTSPTPAHAFSLTGNFRVLLRASSPTGSDTLSRVITIRRGGLPAALLASLVGTYRGVLHSRVMVPGTFPPAYNSTRRDTVLPVAALDSRTLRCLDATLLYQPGTMTRPSSYWDGHAPQRSNYLFFNGAPPSNRATLQFEQQGDSCYLYKRVGGLGSGDEYRFYGRKRP